MKQAVLLSALMVASTVWAADTPKPPKKTLVDHSNALLISSKDALAVLDEGTPAKVWKINPASRYAFVSQVEGGMKGSTCIVSARVMLVPLTPAAKAVLFRPLKMATAFDALPNSSTDACRTMAREKLAEATAAVVSSIAKT